MNITGRLEPTDARAIAASRWSIGGETLDRGYADYHAYKAYLGPLCAKRIRLQAGWARCERVAGQYDFAWLDGVVDDALAQGVQPWLELSYGNPIHEGGGTAALAGGIPSSEAALQAWDAWVSATVERYRDRVREWEIWNEPDISKLFDHKQFAVFYLRTARLVRQVQPGAYLVAMGLANPQRSDYVEAILRELSEHDALHLVDAISYHGYRERPEDVQDGARQLRELVDRYDRRIQLWQGENGAPSVPAGQSVGALSRVDWSQLSQAKWVLRRMAGDLSLDVAVSSIFQIADMHYGPGDHMTGYNAKGLVRTGPDHQVVSIKQGWHAYRRFAAVMSGPVTVHPAPTLPGDDGSVMSVACRRDGAGALIYWDAAARPSESPQPDGTFELPVKGGVSVARVLLEPISGKLLDVGRDAMTESGRLRLPVWDSPMLLLDRAWLDALMREGVFAVVPVATPAGN